MENDHIPNLRHLRAIAAVARFHSISGAARHIHLSQPAITQAIGKMERELGVDLFTRNSKGVFPTETGTRFADRIDRVLTHLRTATESLVRNARKGKASPILDQLLTAVQIRALIALSGSGNFSMAARAIGLAQPSLHRAARELEANAGVTLFEKSSHGIRLTRSAETLAWHFRLARSEIAQAYGELEESKGFDGGSIVIGTMPLARTFVLPTAISAMLRNRPETKIRVVDGPYSDLLHGLRHGEIDMLVGALRDPLPVDDVTQEALFSDPLVIVGRSGHPLLLQSDVRLDDLAAFPWVLPMPGTPTRQIFDQMFDRGDTAPPAHIIEASSLILTRGLMAQTDRLTLISLHQIRHERQTGLLAPINYDVPNARRQIGLTMRRDWHPTATQDQFLTLMRNAGAVVHSS